MYYIVTSIVALGIIIPFSGVEMTVYSTFSYFDYSLTILAAVCGGIGMLLKSKSFQFERFSRLSILMYLSVIFTFLFDLAFIGTEFTTREA